MATILLLEPHPLLRLGLRHLLAQAHVPGDLVDLDPGSLHQPDPWTHHADLLIFGLPADAAQGWQMLGDLCERLQPLRVLVLAEHVPAPLPEAGLPDAVRGVLAKTCSSDALEAAIRLVLAGGECFPSQVPPARQPEAAQGARHAAAPIVVPLHSVPVDLPGAAAVAAPVATPETPAAGAHLLNITERQYEVLALLARGYPIKTVSRLLNISVATAKTHACTLYQRLHVRNKGEAVYVALQRGATLNWIGPTPAQPTHIPMSSLHAREACEAA
ncbi:helix-turn-helix transcriptional regulator [Cupriavidus agavae]|uniref:DNA-binding NarL/FixJ family response regulator n=1 Tax=Cupriavidus agavae TaxID=1001822 RepID=A0A4Q7RGR3_9BURK|nr:response regulator transcription factor [Cupriavidus agavae]RZT31827.1 DNA-binding NarL/FixJ family response regulator [Cupriavidus agavae]